MTNTAYNYDDANRLKFVNGVEYFWDDNGNLLNDGVNTYEYDSANRLISINEGQTATYAYNGLGDRLSQNGVNYTLDLNAGLTQALNDGTNTYLYGVGRIAQVNTSTEYFLTDALGSVRQLTDEQGGITLANAYEPYGTLAQSAGSAQTSYGFTGESTDTNGLIYLRVRYYNPIDSRFMSRDSWGGDYGSPLSLNLWSYVQSNPVNYTDPSGNIRIPCVLDGGWRPRDIKWRVDEAEKYVTRTSDPLDTYVAAGIAIQCAGYDNPNNPYSGNGIAQITPKQVETKWGEPIYEYTSFGVKVREYEGFHIKIVNGKIVYKIRGYGLGCPDGQFDEPLNPQIPSDAVILMKREIQLVLAACGSKCTDTDKYIAAALAQNGPGFSYIAMGQIGNITPKIKKQYGLPDNIQMLKNWFGYFDLDADDGDMVNTKTQLNRFINVVNELSSRGWIVPYIDPAIDKLRNWQE